MNAQTDSIDTALREAFFEAVRPSPPLKLANWMEHHFRLPEGASARPGRFKNWPYLVEPINSIGDPSVERVTLQKSVRLGFTKALVGATFAIADTDPCSIIVLLPTDDDARGFAVDEIDPAVEASPRLGEVFLHTGKKDGKNTLTRRALMGGGSLKVLSARAPRKLRRHDAKVLLVDEADAIEITNEGNAVLIAEKRTFAHPDRKIVIGGTPTEEDVSEVERNYLKSDRRVFEVACIHCGEWNEILWEHLIIPYDEHGNRVPDETYYQCPHCKGAIEERFKAQMAHSGRWRATRPEVKNHRGYRINALVSLLANAAWPKLAQEWLDAQRDGPAAIQVFVNTILAKTWKATLGRTNAQELLDRVETAIGLDRIPHEVLALSAGVDTQADRLEMTILGWKKPIVLSDGRKVPGAPIVLGHVVVPGSTLAPETWAKLDDELKRTFEHPNGWKMVLDAVAIDSGGDEGRTEAVYRFCNARSGRGIYAIKGISAANSRTATPIWNPATKTKDGSRLYLIDVDQVKTELMERMSAPLSDPDTGELNEATLRYSSDLPPSWFEQATNERRVVRYVKNKPVASFERKKPGVAVEAWDCLVYGTAVRHSPPMRSIDYAERDSRRGPVAAETSISKWSSLFNR